MSRRDLIRTPTRVGELQKLLVVGLLTVVGFGCSSSPEERDFDPLDVEDPGNPANRGPNAIDQLARPESPGPKAPDRMVLPSGIHVGVAPTLDDWVDLRWTFPHRKTSPTILGDARLTARLLLDAPLRDSTAPSLRRQIESLGGRIDTDVSSFGTAVDLRVPADRWQVALRALCGALETVPTATLRAEKYAEEESRALTTIWLDDPLAALITRVRTFERKQVSDWVDQAESASLLRAQRFRGEHYTAKDSILVGRFPIGPRALDELAVELADWGLRNPGKRRPAATERLSPEGLFWAPARTPNDVSVETSATTPEGYAEVAWVYELPPLGAAGAEPTRIALELLTFDGVGGRLARTLEDQLSARIPLRAETLDETDRTAIRLRTTVPVEGILPLRDAVELAIGSLLEDPPYPQEWRAAAERARLRFHAEVTSRDGWLRAATQLLRHSSSDNFYWTDEGVQPSEEAILDPWVYGQLVMRNVSADVLAPALAAVVGRVPLLVALGGQPIRVRNVFPLDNALLSDRRLEVTVADDTERRQRADKQWQKAFEALGGPMRLGSIFGYRAKSITQSGRGPEVAEIVAVHADGRFHRMRRILDSIVHTVAQGDRGYDRIEREQIDLEFDDLRGQRQELLRHPLILAARAARGEDRYRVVSVQQVRDRELVVLERIGDDTQALRVWIDSGSGLIRTVRSLENRSDGAVWVREDYFDYRDTGNGVSGPFQRHTSFDGSLRGLTTRWVEFDPTAPLPAALLDEPTDR